MSNANLIMNEMIVSDSGWVFDSTASIPRRGIYDYQRDIEFSRSLDSEELKLVNNFLMNDPKCPGWTPIKGYQAEGNMRKYHFTVTADSSD